jgi:hypothetical protein
MAMQWLNELGDRNPQLLRELRARFQVRSVGATIGISLALQVLVVLFFVLRLPDQPYQQYCLSKAVGECSKIDWRMWWGDIFKILTYLIPYVLCIPGVYAIGNDLSQEAQKGTINILRLSPRSSQNILLGKLIGVPILGYFSLILIMPLHIIAAFLGAISPGFFFSFYLTLVAWTVPIFLATTSLTGFRKPNTQSPSSNGVGPLFIFFILITMPIIQVWNVITVWNWFKVPGLHFENNDFSIKWFSLNINNGFAIPHLFLLVNISLVVAFFYVVLNRAFQKPTAKMKKAHSYGIVLYVTISLLGLILADNLVRTSQAEALAALSVVSAASIFPMLLLIISLLSSRQSILDWLRSRQEIALDMRSQSKPRAAQRSEQIRDWVFGERSPGIIAVCINLLIVFCALFLILFQIKSDEFNSGWIGLLLTITLIANYGFLAQLMLMMETAKRDTWALGSLACAVVIPSIAASLPVLDGGLSYFTPGLWTFLLSRGYRSADLTVANIALIAHVAILYLQIMLFRRKLRQLSRQL